MSETIQIGFRENRTAYRPGEEITGAVRWELEEAPESAELRLCWYTRGKGTSDAEAVETVTLDSPQRGDVREFSFRVPEGPYSFSGKLISLLWCVEICFPDEDRSERGDIVIGPDAKEVVLPVSA